MTYLQQLDGGEIAVAAQEHHVDERGLLGPQREARDRGWHGLWSGATPSPSSDSGTQGGAAILAPTCVDMTAPPRRDDATLLPGRLIAAAFRGGVAALSARCRDAASLDAGDLAIIWELAR